MQRQFMQTLVEIIDQIKKEQTIHREQLQALLETTDEQAVSYLRDTARKVADNIENDLRGISPNALVGGTVGLILGLIIAYLLTQIYQDVITQKSLYLTVTVLLYAAMAFLGSVIGSKKGAELLALYASNKRAQQTKAAAEENSYG